MQKSLSSDKSVNTISQPPTIALVQFSIAASNFPTGNIVFSVLKNAQSEREKKNLFLLESGFFLKTKRKWSLRNVKSDARLAEALLATNLLSTT